MVRIWDDLRPMDSERAYREQIARLYERSSFYRDKLRAAGFADAAAAGGLDAIAKLPFTEKDELRRSQAERPPLGSHAGVTMEEAARIYSTSGTSGVPLHIPLTRRDLDDWCAIAVRSYARSGAKKGERWVTTYNSGPFVAAAALSAFDALGVTHIPVGTGHTEKILAALRSLDPQVLVCTPSYALHIAETAAKQNVKTDSLKRIMVAGEPGGGEESFRRKLEAAFGAKVFEVMGIGVMAASLWGECEHQAGMHFSGDGYIHVELIDPQSGKTVEMKDGATGELVYTHLRREAAPLLRFRSRDHVMVWSSRCACGADTLRTRCIGRTDDMLIVRGVNVFPSAVREVVARYQPRVTGAILIRPRNLGVKQEPPLTVIVEGEGDAAFAEQIAKDIRNTLVFTPEVKLVKPQSLPRSEYKSKLVDFSEAV
jgi:phenylacetate-CoA ligase